MKRLLLLGIFCASACFATDSISILTPASNPTWTGWNGNSFTVAITGTDVALVCYTADANPATNPGPPGVISGSVGAFLATGCFDSAPFSMPVNSFIWLNGPHQVIATAYDNKDQPNCAASGGTWNGIGCAVATSAPATFVIGNNWPISCTPVLGVTTGTALTSTWSGQVTATATITGGCSTDTFQYYWYLNGVQQNWGSASITFDTTSVLNGQVNIGLMGLDTTSGLAFNTGAVEWSRTVTVCNGTSCSPSSAVVGTEVRGNAREMNLTLSGPTGGNCDAAADTVGSCIQVPQLINGDGTAQSSPTFYFYSTNTNAATISGGTCTTGSTGKFCTGANVTVTGAGIGNSQIQTTGVTHSGSDGVNNGSPLYALTSPSYTFRPTDNGRIFYILGGANSIPGAYMIKAVTTGGAAWASSPLDPGGAQVPIVTGASTNLQWALGPMRTLYAYVGSGVPNVAHYSANGAILNSYVASGAGASRYWGSIFLPTGCFTEQPYPVPCGQNYSNSGFNNIEFGAFGNNNGTTGTQAAWVTAETAYLQGETALIAPWPNLRANCRFDAWATGSVLLNFEFGIPSASNWPGGGSTGVPSGVAGSAGTAMYLLTNAANVGGLMTMCSLEDEITAQGWTGPLQGPLHPATSGTVNNWLGPITCNGTSCTATTYTTTPGGQYNLGTTFTISGSTYLGGTLNSVYPGYYTVTPINSTSFSFACTTCTAGTYSASTDPNLTIQNFGQFGASSWILNSLTSTEEVMNFDAWASYINQMKSISPHVPFGGSFQGQTVATGAAGVACWSKSVSDCGQSINTTNTGGNTIASISPDINDGYYTHLGVEYYLRSRQSLNSTITDYWNASLEEGQRLRTLVDILDPNAPLSIITQADSTIYLPNGPNTYTVVSCVGNTITLSAPHNLTNIVPGVTRFPVTGSSDSNCNTNFYVIAAPTPTTLSVVYAATKTACLANGSGTCGYHNASAATLTFANGDKIGVGSTLLNNGSAAVPLYEISADGLTEQMGSGTTLFNYGTAATSAGTFCGALGTPSIAANSVTRDRGQFFTLSGVTGTGASYFNGTTFYYDIENLSVPQDTNGSPTACFNYFREVPVLSGTGGTARITPDNLFVTGRDEFGFSGLVGNPLASSPGAIDPDFGFMSVVECQMLRCAGNRDYQYTGNLQSYNPAAVTISGTVHKGGFAHNAGASFNPTWTGQQNQLGLHPNVENWYAVPDWKAGSFGNLMIERSQKFYLGSTPANAPDYGPEMDAAAYKGNAAGNLLVVGNFVNGPQARTVALCSDPRNLCTSGQNIIRYIADARGIYATETIAAGTMTESLTLQEGQAAWYTFPTLFSGELNQPATQTLLSQFSSASSTVIRYAYDRYYLDATPGNVFSCGSAAVCSPPWDRNIGAIYYRLIYLNSAGARVARSDVQTY